MLFIMDLFANDSFIIYSLLEKNHVKFEALTAHVKLQPSTILGVENTRIDITHYTYMYTFDAICLHLR